MSDISSIIIPGLTGLIFALILWAPKRGAWSVAVPLAIVSVMGAETYQLILRPKLMVPLSESAAIAVQIAIMGLFLLLSWKLFWNGIKQRP